ncbi:MAG: tripartite tricarboxylate transporter TctB family protein [Phyllobacteriaceae bacterium]|nr:tripartite tricarboxylate transporter TctB family protein [Phyllobacteriaceae bacterium]
MKLSRRAFESCIALISAAMPCILLLFVFDDQIPTSGLEEIGPRVYPDTLAYAWLALSLLYLADQWTRNVGEPVEIGGSAVFRSLAIIGVVLVGFLVLNVAGYLLGAVFYILCFTWMMNERGWAALVLSVVTPVVVYVALEAAFQVRLPTILD